MPGTNWNSIAPDGMDLFEKIAKDGGNEEKIDKKWEFKEFEKVINDKDSWWKEVLATAVTKDQWKVLNLFDDKQLGTKVAEASKADSKQSEDVKNAYKVLWAYKKGKSWSYEQVLEQVEGEEALLKTKQKMLKMIDKNNDWSKSLKEVGKTVIEDLFAECDSVEEFERRAWTKLSVLEWMDNIGDFFKAIPEFVFKEMEHTISAKKDMMKKCAEFTEAIWYGAVKLFKDLIEKWIAERKDLINWCTEKGQKISDIAKTVCERWKSQFNIFLSYLKERWEDISEALTAAWEWTWKQWNKLVDFCDWKREDVKAFWIKLVEKWEIVRNTLLEWLQSKLEELKDVAKTLFELWLIKFNEFSDRCKWVWEKWMELIISILEWNKNLIKDFVNWCIENWNDTKEWFKDVCKTMLEKWKMLASEFVELCKNSWETVKDVACNVLISLVNAGKLTLRVVFDALIVLPAVAVAWICKLLIKAWKEVIKDTKALAEFIADLAVMWREKIKTTWIAFADFIKGVTETIKELWIKFGNAIADLFKSMREWLEKAGIAAIDFIKATYDIAKKELWEAWDKTATFFRNLWIGAKDVILTLRELSKEKWNNVVDYTLNTLKSVQDAFKFLVDKCKIWIDAIWSAIMKAWERIWDFINYVKGLWIITYEKIRQWCGNVGEKITLFVRTAIDTCKATRNDLVKWCWGKVEQIKDVLIELYWKTTEWLKKLINLIWWAVIDAWKIILKLWIAIPALMIMALKELKQSLVAITKLFVETLVKYGDMAVSALCEALAEAFGKGKEMIIKIWQTVADFLKSSAESIRTWILEKTKDAVQAIKAMETYITSKVSDLCNWLYEQWLAIQDIASTIMTVFKWQIRAIAGWVKAFYDLCKDKLHMSRREFKNLWNSGVKAASDYLTID